MRKLISILAIGILTSCETTSVSTQENKWFNIQNFTSTIVTSMSERSPKVSKTFTLNNVVESREFSDTDSSFWAKQLAALSEIDLNAPSLQGAIVFEEGEPDKNSNLLIDSYSIDRNVGVSFKKLSLYYLAESEEIRRLSAEIESDNLIAHSETKIDLWFSRYNDKILLDSLLIIGEDITLMQATRCYEISSKTLWE